MPDEYRPEQVLTTTSPTAMLMHRRSTVSWLFTDFGEIPLCNCSLLKLSISRTPIAFKRNLPKTDLRCRSKMIVFDRTSLGLFVALAYVFKDSSANASNLGTSRSAPASATGLIVLRIFVRTLLSFYRKRARERGVRDGRTASVTFVQRFGSAANLNMHGHVIVLDGAFAEADDGTLVFHAAATSPSRATGTAASSY